jgi:hypothetical protein
VYVSQSAPPYAPGETSYGRNQYTEYLAGDLPIIVSAPHGGYVEAMEIPDRTYGVIVQDRNTQELIRQIAAEAFQRTGRHPHIVICRLHRTKLDANREVVEAAQGNPFAERAWKEYHGFIEEAKQAVTTEHGSGLYLDLHGHGHAIQRLELGYLLSGSELGLPDDQLNGASLIAKSSIRALAAQTDTTFVGLIRGPTSLGGLLQVGGFPTVPSPSQPHPGGEPYFSGGHDTWRHGSRDGGTVSGIQIEANFTGVRDTEASREAFAEAVTLAIETYLDLHFGIAW